MEMIISWFSLGLSVAAAVFTLFTYRSGIVHDRKQATLDAFNTLQNEAFDKLNLRMPKEIEEVAKNTRSTEYKEISSYIARIEHFCVGVREKIYDRKTVYLLAHGYMDGAQLRRRIDPIIERKQSGASEDYYANIHWMLQWMEDYGKKNNNRKEK